MKKRKYLSQGEEEYYTYKDEEKKYSVKDMDDLEQALKGVDDDDALGKSSARVEERVGKIFSDSEYFPNIDKVASHI